jgi:simple sugar transport system permease protein
VTVVDPGVGTEPGEPREPAPGRRDPISGLPAWVRWGSYAFVAMFVLSVVQEVTDERGLSAPNTWRSALELTVPIAMAGLGGLWAERAGVINIGLEGMMALGTWFGAWGCIEFGPWAGIVIGMLGGAAGGLIHAIATVTFGVDQIVSGVAINLLGTGLTQFLNSEVYGSNIDSPQLTQNLPSVTVPGLSDLMHDLGDRGPFFLSQVGRVLEGLTTDVSLLVILAVALFPISAFILWRSPFGLRLRSVGEDPEAAESLGVPVYTMKYAAVVVSGALSGLGGVALVYIFANQFQAEQTNGRGFIGLAAMIFGNWLPGGTLLGALLFGLTDAMRLQDDATAHALLLFVGIICVLLVLRALYLGRRRTALVTTGAGLLALGWYAISESVPNEIISFLPHLTTLIVLVFAAQRLRPPAADGRVFRRGQGR